jgi:hypothetical protein
MPGSAVGADVKSAPQCLAGIASGDRGLAGADAAPSALPELSTWIAKVLLICNVIYVVRLNPRWLGALLQ